MKFKFVALATVCLATAAHAQTTPPPPIANSPEAQSQAAQPAQQGGGQPVIDIVGGISAPMPIAIPTMPTSAVVDTPAGSTDVLGQKLADIITNDLRGSGLFTPVPPAQLRTVVFPEVTAPAYDYWGGTGAQSLVQGYVRANSNGTLTVGCYLYDVSSKVELIRQGFVVSPGEWRRAGHKCADAIYARLTGEGPYFDTQVVYIAESGPKNRRRKQLAIMDQDGANHRFLTNGQSIVLTPRLSPKLNAILYMSFERDRPSIHIYDLASRQDRVLVANVALNFAPHWSPDARWVVFSMAVGGNTDIYRVPASGGTPQRLTTSPGIDTGGSYSPDGSKIVFESDRGGTQQLYVMNADGSNQHRISFGGGRYAAPAWSPRGDQIAFTRMGGGAFRIGVMNPSGGGEQLLTNSWGDEGPSWAPNGRVIIFFRSAQGSGRPDLWTVDLTGRATRKVPTPLDGSDPNWGAVRP
ncbi:Tol-Pal system beta propeller repeat protein TolB [uncultured Sphingomonas sp.]|uniref:Tol-Pal system beta propeller repeat protein TolB n=1 Tax=uncultured Sphingomonas sp. TaxID=158754 RepID=UPI0025DF8D54|nr:Tol-Pal system beta propeller repeat protein TolB [uncultured Sphingomonas sp.]